jgi:tetratricopeptide (TPR) repeat protein
MKALRVLATIATLAGAAILILVLSIEPYQNNLMKHRIENEIGKMFEMQQSATPSPAIAERTRANVERIQQALRLAPADVDLYMELAAEYRMLGRLDDAASSYRNALRYDRRPEIYRNLGEVDASLGDRDAAVDDFAHALAFAPSEEDLIPNYLLPDVRRRAAVIVAAAAR